MVQALFDITMIKKGNVVIGLVYFKTFLQKVDERAAINKCAIFGKKAFYLILIFVNY